MLLPWCVPAIFQTIQPHISPCDKSGKFSLVFVLSSFNIDWLSEEFSKAYFLKTLSFANIVKDPCSQEESYAPNLDKQHFFSVYTNLETLFDTKLETETITR